MLKLSNIIIAVSTIVIVILLTIIWNKDKTLEQTEYNYGVLNEKVEYTDNKLGEASAKVNMLEGENLDFLKVVENLDSANIRLLDLAEAYRKELKNNGSIVVIKDSIRVDSFTKVVYRNDSALFNYQDKWITLGGVIISDNLDFNLSIINKYSYVIGEQRKNIFGKRRPFVIITNENPYSNITSVKSFNVKKKVKHFGLGAAAGYGVISNGGVLQTGPGIVLGLTYTF